jgi:hypothetical protein
VGKNTLTYHRSHKAWGPVFKGSVKNIVLLNERRIALTELTRRLQSQNQLTLASALCVIDQRLEER